jgi:ABC-type uncharacterized transport system ATPase subunit
MSKIAITLHVNGYDHHLEIDPARSHNLARIRKLCARAILLESGAIVADGPTQQVIVQYFDTLNKGSTGTKTDVQFNLEPNLPMQIQRVVKYPKYEDLSLRIFGQQTQQVAS